jgi:Zn-finger nucleic acid-binding protein
MTCQQCGAQMRADRDRGLFICDYCGSQATPPVEDDGVLLLGPAAVKCAVGTVPLFNGTLESIELLVCKTCRGMLISMEDFPALVSQLRSHREGPAAFISSRSTSDADRKLPCPKCGSAMDNHPYGGGGNVNIDSCEACEVIWLDRGELRKIASAADRVAYT